MNLRLPAACAPLLAMAAFADTAFDAPGNFNPILPGYFADPTIKKFGDVFHLYATTDGNGGGRGPATVWVSVDFVNWVLVPMNWPRTPHYWAPDVVKRPDGRYYLFYNQPCNTFAGVSDAPIGPWTPLTPGDGLVIKDHLVKDVITLDTQLFEDKDGSLYGYWGTWGIFPRSGCGYGVFNPDLKSFARLGMIPNTQAKDFFEAPFMIERNGVYYFTYSSGSCHDASYRVQYAVGNRPDGEFRMGPNNPILESSADGTVHGPGHHSILRAGEDYLMVYHRHDLPVTPNGMHRQTCADRLVFDRDGVIRKVAPTHRGVGALGPASRPPNLAAGKKVVASSHYRDALRGHEYQPRYAVDDNNATLWRPGDNHPGHWLTVDLGAEQRVRRTETQFEYGTWFYQYLIEASLDAQDWRPFADRRQNTRWGSPMVDDGDVVARYLRITVTGTEFPGLFGALWNFKAYSEAPADPLLALADRAFNDWAASARSGELPSPNASSAASQGSPALGASRAGPILPLIQLDVAALQLGAPVAAWTNHGTLGGEFGSGEARPIVAMAGGCKALRFSGKQILTASFAAPRSLAGNSSYTVTAWVNNPEIAESECLVSWAGRGGPDATTAQVGYGTQRDWGAVGHWGFADLGFRAAPPKAGAWHHLAVVFDGVIERVYVDGELNNSEAKMLLMHQGRPIYVGASEPGTEPYDGYLASLRIYDRALGEAQIRSLAGEAPAADVLVHADSAKLDYGPLASWPNSGSLGGALVPTGPAPRVADVGGRIAVQFEKGQSLELIAPVPVPLPECTVLASVWNPSAEPAERLLDLLVDGGGEIRVPASVPTQGWHQVAVGSGQTLRVTVDGQPTVEQPMPLRSTVSIRGIRIGGAGRGESSFSGAVARVQLFRRTLTGVELKPLHELWQAEWQPPTPNPAAFAQAPAAIRSTAVAMTAQRSQAPFGPVEYLFSETAGGPGAGSSGWIATPFFLDDGLRPDTRYAYTVAARDALGNLSAAAAPVEVVTGAAQFREFSDRFDASRDYLVQGTAGTIWDGYLAQDDQSAPEVIAARDGQLRLQSRGTVWDGGKPLGAFLYKVVTGDFVAQVAVADYAGLATRRVPGNNDGGLMVRVPQAADAGPGEDLVQLNFFPIWNQGNMVTVLDGGRSQRGNQRAWDAHRHLQLIRRGTFFHFRTSADGQDWRELPGSPVERKDMAGLPLQVGVYHASYGAESSHVGFSAFELTTRR